LADTVHAAFSLGPDPIQTVGGFAANLLSLGLGLAGAGARPWRRRWQQVPYGGRRVGVSGQTGSFTPSHNGDSLTQGFFWQCADVDHGHRDAPPGVFVNGCQ
jgi:hypothetical protein